MNAATARTIREALGLSTSRLAELLGLAGHRDVQRAEAGSRLVTKRHAEMLLALEARARAMIEGAAATLADGPAVDAVAVVRYRAASDMLPGTAPDPFELHAAVLAAVRLRLGERLAIVDFNREGYLGWLGDRSDTQAHRAAWAASQSRHQEA